MIFCPSHPDAPLVDDYRAGDQICSECGLVVGDRSDISLFLSFSVNSLFCRRSGLSMLVQSGELSVTKQVMQILRVLVHLKTLC